MKVALFDENHEEDLEEEINYFIKGKEVVDIKYQVAIMRNKKKEIYCYSALVMYKEVV